MHYYILFLTLIFAISFVVLLSSDNSSVMYTCLFISSIALISLIIVIWLGSNDKADRWIGTWKGPVKNITTLSVDSAGGDLSQAVHTGTLTLTVSQAKNGFCLGTLQWANDTEDKIGRDSQGRITHRGASTNVLCSYKHRQLTVATPINVAIDCKRTLKALVCHYVRSQVDHQAVLKATLNKVSMP